MKAELKKEQSIEDYHLRDGYISKSSLANIIDCPAKYKYWLDNPQTDKKHFNIGNAVHTLALEPELFHARFFVIPEGIRKDARTEKYQAVLAEAGNKKIISKEDMTDILGMAESLRNNKKALALLQAKGLAEASIYWQEDGLGFKCRPDFMRDEGLIVDLKMTKSAYKPFFQKDAHNYHYDMSVALTSRGYKALTGELPQNYVFLAVENKPPYVIEAYDSFRDFNGMDSLYKFGEYRLSMAIDKLKECRQTGDWHSYNRGIEALGIPSYAVSELAEQGE